MAVTAAKTRRRWVLAALSSALLLVALLIWLSPGQTPADTPAQIPTTLPRDRGPAPPMVAGEVSVRTLVAEMTDLGRLARWPEPAYRTHLASSYDRRSRTPDEADGWFANDDFVSPSRPGYERVEKRDGRTEYVLLDAKGPGAIVHIWSATPVGTLRIYIDGSTKPALEASMQSLLSGEIAPFTHPFAYVSARGANLYFPFPFRERCVVSVDSIETPPPEPGKFYFQIGYRLYDGGAVRSYADVELSHAEGAIAAARDLLDHPRAARSPGITTRRKISRTSVAPQTPLEVDVDGGTGSEIRELTLRAFPATEQTLRETWIDISFDGEDTVRAPLGDFFGSGPGPSSFTTIVNEMSEAGMVSRWVMPFRKHARLAFRTSGSTTVELEGEALVVPAVVDDRTMRFHATWRAPETFSTRPFRDVTLAAIAGRGVYVGTVLNVRNTPRTNWWGEGDEKIWVDGEAFPSWFGTGTEDYFGYAWSTPEKFWRPFHAQTRADGPRFDGRFSMSRWHVMDAIPFERSLRFDMEVWHWSTTTIALDSVAYFYAMPR